MRLLRYNDDDTFGLTSFFESDNLIPQYAILSHTWGRESEEVTFADMNDGTSNNKLGFAKIKFCGEQARRDGLLYFWVDTCCIDKENGAELARSINSMFRWYRNASRCYVYLSDVPSRTVDMHNCSPQLWESDFRRSRWFTRGWTLQELLAPASVEFFSLEGERLGDRKSLSQQICDSTNIHPNALQGDSLFQFSIEERMRWIEYRETGKEEDKAYSLLGIFGVYIIPIYGEGMTKAFDRLWDEIHKMQECIKDLRLTDPRLDKQRIEATKGGLLEQSYRWVIETSDFQQWRNSKLDRLLWIKGDPGKGKTMLLCGIANELKKFKHALLAFFFCQATDSRINYATAVLRGLIYLIVDQQPSLLLHVRRKYDQAGKVIFEDANAWFALKDILISILQDPILDTTYLLVDGLDECRGDLPKLLDLIAQTSSESHRIKWVVSSRNWPEIEKTFNNAAQKRSLCLELNDNSVSAAVANFIQWKVDELAMRNNYKSVVRNAVQQHLALNANGTFLWVALVSQELSNLSAWKAIKKLKEFPSGLNALYQQMLDQIVSSEDAELCIGILAVASTVYRPITLHELVVLVDMPDEVASEHEALVEIIGYCRSFLTLREGAIFFVHQSAKEFLVDKASKDPLLFRIQGLHSSIFSRSVQAMSRILKRNIYSLAAPGISIDQVKLPVPDPLATIHYPCLYWVDHIIECDALETTQNGIKDGSSIYEFLNQSFLYWVEALSLMHGLSRCIEMIMKLEKWVQAKREPELFAFMHDAGRFILHSRSVIEQAPLQLYCAALVFAPEKSIIRERFEKYIPTWIERMPRVQAHWSAALQTLEGHSDWVMSVAFSLDGKQVASGSKDKTVRIWDAATGTARQTLEHSDHVTSVAFSLDGKQVASGSDKTVQLWDAATGAALQALEDHFDQVTSVAFSPNGKQVASGSRDKTVRIWDTATGTTLQTLEHSDHVTSVAFSLDGKQVASGSVKTVQLWDAATGTALQMLEHSDYVTSIAFSLDGKQVVSGFGKTVRLWNIATGTVIQTLDHSSWVSSVAFSPNGKQVASGSGDGTVWIWDVVTGTALQALEHSSWVNSVAFSPDGKQVASTSDETVRLWDTVTNTELQALEHSSWFGPVAFSPDGKQVTPGSGCKSLMEVCDAVTGEEALVVEYSRWVVSVAFSPDGKQVASRSNEMVQLWDTSTGTMLQALEDSENANSVVFSPDGKQVACISDEAVRIWDAATGAALQTFEHHSDYVTSVAFSPDGKQIACISDETVQLRDPATGTVLQTLEHSSRVDSVVFSPDGKVVACVSDEAVRFWDAVTGSALHTLENSDDVTSVAFSPDGKQVACISDETVQLRDAANGLVLQTLNHSDWVDSVAFSPDGKQVASISEETVRLWDAAAGTALPLVEHSGWAGLAAFSSDGNLLPTLRSSNNWVVEGEVNILWLPPDYRPNCEATFDETIVLGHLSGGVSVLQFRSGPKLMV